MKHADPEWPVLDTGRLPTGHLERAVRHQRGLEVALGVLRALSSDDLQGIEPAHALQWIAVGVLDRRGGPA